MPALPKIVAEGDSWFKKAPARTGIIFYLERSHAKGNYDLSSNIASPGDTLQDMREDQLDLLVNKVSRRKGTVGLLLSGGGNDLLASKRKVTDGRFYKFLRKKSSGVHPGDSPLDEAAVEAFISADVKSLKRWYMDILDAVLAKNPDLFVVLHGYGRAVPDGRGFEKASLMLGPWLHPAFELRGYDDDEPEDWDFRRRGIDRILEMFNDMVRGLSETPPYAGRVIYLDLRSHLTTQKNFEDDDYLGDWDDELHPTPLANKRLAQVFHDAIMQRLA